MPDDVRRAFATLDLPPDSSRAAVKTVVYVLPHHLGTLVQEVENLRELLAAVQMTVPLQEWRLAHGGYPATLPVSPASARYNLSYRPSADRHGHQLVSRAGAIVLDVNDGASPASRGQLNVYSATAVSCDRLGRLVTIN